MEEGVRSPRSPGPVVGRFVTVKFRAAPSGLAFELVELAGTTLRLKPLLPSGAAPYEGERVECQSSIGEWTTTAIGTRDGVLELAAPRWLSRPTRRRWRRVELDEPVTVRATGQPWAARLQDVSMHGAAVVVERSAGIRTGDELVVDVPGGAIRATVRSVRHHPQRLLVVVGVAYDRLEPGAMRFVAGVVGGGRRPGEPGPPAMRSSGV